METQKLLDRALQFDFLNANEGLFLFENAATSDLMFVANELRKKQVPSNKVTWIIDRNANTTNVCNANCKFCNFFRIPGHKDAYITTLEEYTEKIEETIRYGGEQLLLQGGHHPELGLDFYCDLFSGIKKKFPNIKGPIKEDICYATTNRQSAVKEIASKCDMFFVVGSRNSSNSVRLVEVAKKAGCNNSHLMHSEKEIPFNEIDNSETIGISSGASAPEKLVQTLLDSLRKDRNVSIEEVIVAEEKVVFKLPKELN